MILNARLLMVLCHSLGIVISFHLQTLFYPLLYKRDLQKEFHKFKIAKIWIIEQIFPPPIMLSSWRRLQQQQIWLKLMKYALQYSISYV